MPSVSAPQHRWIEWIRHDPAARAKTGMSQEKVNEWSHADKGAPWKKAMGGPMMPRSPMQRRPGMAGMGRGLPPGMTPGFDDGGDVPQGDAGIADNGQNTGPFNRYDNQGFVHTKAKPQFGGWRDPSSPPPRSQNLNAAGPALRTLSQLNTGNYDAGGQVQQDLGVAESNGMGAMPTPDPISGGPAPNVGNQNPMVQQAYQRYASMPAEKLQELAVMMPPNSSQGQIVRQALAMQRMKPQQQTQQQQQPAAQSSQGYDMGGGVGEMIGSGPFGMTLPQTRQGSSIPNAPQPPSSQDQSSQLAADVIMRSAGHHRQQPASSAPSSSTAAEDNIGLGDMSDAGVTDGVQGFDMGGDIPLSMADPWWTRNAANQEGRMSTGYLNGSTFGRADHVTTQAPGGAYVVPADVVSGLGEGNSMAGANVIQRMLQTGPYGTPLPRGGHGHSIPRPPRPEQQQATGGGTRGGHVGHDGVGKPVPVKFSHGEYVIKPEEVLRIARRHFGYGVPRDQAMKNAHELLDAWVIHKRKEIAKKMMKLPGPTK